MNKNIGNNCFVESKLNNINSSFEKILSFDDVNSFSLDISEEISSSIYEINSFVVNQYKKIVGSSE